MILGPIEFLLLVIFDDFGRAGLGLVGIFTKFAEGAALAEQVPALIEFDFNFVQAQAVVFAERVLRVKLFLFFHQLIDVAQNGLIAAFACHGFPLSVTPQKRVALPIRLAECSPLDARLPENVSVECDSPAATRENASLPGAWKTNLQARNLVDSGAAKEQYSRY